MRRCEFKSHPENISIPVSESSQAGTCAVPGPFLHDGCLRMETEGGGITSRVPLLPDLRKMDPFKEIKKLGYIPRSWKNIEEDLTYLDTVEKKLLHLRNIQSSVKKAIQINSVITSAYGVYLWKKDLEQKIQLLEKKR